ncbi:hypothetical protein [uncultured Jannaschia sp.]|uniref:hypothetical protein n=1 Tax=uncultured Jannaschia sp. TaxID=293347 RepID=UPI00260DC98C|nr:hypothetical protein [uncultured Jannaschia sp.]
MTDLRRSHPKLYLLIALPLGAVLAASLFVAGAHARYGLIRATTIKIEAPDQVQPGQVYDIRIHAVGLPFGAGVDISGDATQDRRGIEPIAPGWNTYRVVAPSEAGFYALTARLYAVDEGDPIASEVITPSQVIWMPPTAMCLSRDLDRARAWIAVVSTH